MEIWILAGIVLFFWWLFRNRKKESPNALKFRREQHRDSESRFDDSELFEFEAPDDIGGKLRSARGRTARWIGRDESVTIANVTIDGGLVYVGENLPDQDGYQNENCLVNPKWKVTKGRSRKGDGLSYWPAYHSITASQRWAYLQWLADGRSDPHIDIGFVFLYFYGLERRLFLDGAMQEADLLVAEVQRLQTIYGTNRSFRFYSANFLESAGLLKGAFAPTPVLSLEKVGFELPLTLRTAIGLKLRNGEKLSWDWLLAWFLNHPDTYLRTPARRCFEEFKLLFERRFCERYPGGLSVNAPKRTWDPHYRAASGTFTVALETRYGQIPDPSNLKVPIKIATKIAESVTQDLDAYSRYLGRNPGSENTLAAQLLVPPELPRATGSALSNLQEFLSKRLVDSETRMPVTELAGKLDIDDGRKRLTANKLRLLNKALAACDVGMEPDGVLGGQTIGHDMHVVLFRAKAGGLVDFSRQPFVAARILVELAAIAITADGVADDSEIAVIVEELHGREDLLPMERRRLYSLLSALICSPPQEQSLLRRLAKTDEDTRDSAAQIVLAIVAADGQLDTKEIRLAEKLYKALKLPEARLYADLHGLGAPSRDGPVVIARGEQTKGHPIPQPPKQSGQTGGILLNPDLVAAKRRETAKVSALLATVFAEEESRDRSAVHLPSAKIADRYPGLDAIHAKLVDALIESGEMTQDEFSAMCRKAGIFAAGAIEVINDWAFEILDDILIEDSDLVAIDPTLLEALVKTSATSYGATP